LLVFVEIFRPVELLENPRVDGSIPSQATIEFKHLAHPFGGLFALAQSAIRVSE
jgi:hypothetical protein